MPARRSSKRAPTAPEPIALRGPATDAVKQLKTKADKGRQLIVDLQSVQSQESFDDLSGRYFSWNDYNRTLLQHLFSGDILDQYNRLSAFVVGGPTSIQSDIRERVEDIRGYVRRLESIIERIHLWQPSEEIPMTSESPRSIAPTLLGTRIFIVHGRDDGPRHEIARFLEQHGFQPIILDEQPSGGRTLVEKLEVYATQVGFAIIVLSADDVGALASEQDRPSPRARQNVIFEMGYFIGRLGRSRVCAILVKDLERPSDIDGVAYVSMESNWKLELASELRNVGYEFDLNSP